MVPDHEVMALVAQVADGVFHQVAVVVAKQHAEQPQARPLVLAPAPRE